MLLVDSRAGSKELIEPLEARGLEVVEIQLESGDVAFEGRGEGGTPVQIGIEVKKLPDLVSSMRTGRLEGHQLIGMRGAEVGQEPLYDFAYLLIEGTPLVHNGRLMERRFKRGRPELVPMKGAFSAAELFKRLHVLQLRGGLTPIWSTSLDTTVLQLEMLYRVWTDKNLDEHTSHLAIYNAPPLVPISDTRRALAALPGIGFERSAAAQRVFGSVHRAINATAREWAAVSINNRKLGMAAAEKIVAAIMEGSE